MIHGISMRTLRFFITAAVMLLLIAGRRVYADSIDIYFEAGKAPAGTAYIDLLGRMTPDSEHYTGFNDEGVPLFSDKKGDITPASPIALYDTEGYMSLPLHFKGLTVTVDTDGSGNFLSEHITVTGNGDISDAAAVYRKFGRFRAAYVSAKGEVLGVTDTAVSTLVNEDMRKLTVRGTTAEYEFHSDSAETAKRLQSPTGIISLGIYVMFLIMLIALGIIVIRNIWRFIRKMQKK